MIYCVNFAGHKTFEMNMVSIPTKKSAEITTYAETSGEIAKLTAIVTNNGNSPAHTYEVVHT